MSHQDPSDPAPDQVALQADIERTREDLAETIDELTARLDVKGRAHDKIAEAKAQVTDRLHHLRNRATDADGRPRPPVVAVGAALLAAAVTVVVLSRRRGGQRRGGHR